MKSYFLIFISILFIFSSCFKKEEKNLKYFDINIILNDQIERLGKYNPTLFRKVFIGNKFLSVFKKDNKWKKELQILNDLDISFFFLKNFYNISIKYLYPYKIFKYKIKENIKTKIYEMNIYYNKKKLSKLHIYFKENNILYHSKRNFILKFNKNILGNILISSYLINGKQNIIFNNTVNYHINVDIFY